MEIILISITFMDLQDGENAHFLPELSDEDTPNIPILVPSQEGINTRGKPKIKNMEKLTRTGN